MNTNKRRNTQEWLVNTHIYVIAAPMVDGHPIVRIAHNSETVGSRAAMMVLNVEERPRAILRWRRSQKDVRVGGAACVRASRQHPCLDVL